MRVIDSEHGRKSDHKIKTNRYHGPFIHRSLYYFNETSITHFIPFIYCTYYPVDLLYKKDNSLHLNYLGTDDGSLLSFMISPIHQLRTWLISGSNSMINNPEKQTRSIRIKFLFKYLALMVQRGSSIIYISMV